MSRTSLDQLPAGTPVASAANTLANQLSGQLKSGWPSTWPAIVGSNEDTGIMGPWSANVGETAPSCVVDQITLDLNNWGLPSDPNAAAAIAGQITEEVAAHGGEIGTFYGQSRIAGSETLYWGVAYGTAQITQGSGNTPGESGIVYAFTAQVGFN